MCSARGCLEYTADILARFPERSPLRRIFRFGRYVWVVDVSAVKRQLQTGGGMGVGRALSTIG